MPRSLRIEYEGAVYHVMNRGNGGQEIYQDEEDYRIFLELLGKTCLAYGWSIHSFVLMPNHYHLLLETLRPTLVRGMQYLNSTYAQRYHRRRRGHGHLFQGRYKACMIDNQTPGYFLTASSYIHLNYWRARMVKSVETLAKRKWCGVYWFLQGKIPEWLERRRVFGELGLNGEGVKERRVYEEYLQERMVEEGAQEDLGWKKIRRGWSFGSQEFIEQMKQQYTRLRQGTVASELWQKGISSETEETLASRQIQAVEKKTGKKIEAWDIRDRYCLGVWLRETTGVDTTWIAKALGIKKSGTVRQGLWIARKKKRQGGIWKLLLNR